MKTPKPLRRRLSLNRFLLAAIMAWIVVLTVIILLDPRGAGPTP